MEIDPSVKRYPGRVPGQGLRKVKVSNCDQTVSCFVVMMKPSFLAMSLGS